MPAVRRQQETLLTNTSENEHGIADIDVAGSVLLKRRTSSDDRVVHDVHDTHFDRR